jgi:hypothetical protein
MGETTRGTSAEAFHDIQESGVQADMARTVLSAVRQHGPITRSELDAVLKGPNEVNPSYHKRLSELERKGLVAVVGTRPCRISGRRCAEWAVPPPGFVPVTRGLSQEAIEATVNLLHSLEPLPALVMIVLVWLEGKLKRFKKETAQEPSAPPRTETLEEKLDRVNPKRREPSDASS